MENIFNNFSFRNKTLQVSRSGLYKERDPNLITVWNFAIQLQKEGIKHCQSQLKISYIGKYINEWSRLSVCRIMSITNTRYKRRPSRISHENKLNWGEFEFSECSVVVMELLLQRHFHWNHVAIEMLLYHQQLLFFLDRIKSNFFI